MPRRTVPLIAGNFYHLYNRGHNRAPIFLDQENYRFMLQQLREFVVKEDAEIAAYVLMPNHYHFLVRAKTDKLSHAMQLFGISYTKAMNKRFERTGSIFQGAFQAKLVERDEYLVQLSRYIHLNPVRAGLVRQPEAWTYSSYQEYVGLRNGSLPHPEFVLQLFQTQTSEVCKTSEVWTSEVWSDARERYREFVRDYQPYQRERIKHLLFD